MSTPLAEAIDLRKPAYLDRKEIAAGLKDAGLSAMAMEAAFYDDYLARQDDVRCAHGGAIVTRAEMTPAEQQFMEPVVASVRGLQLSSAA